MAEKKKETKKVVKKEEKKVAPKKATPKKKKVENIPVVEPEIPEEINIQGIPNVPPMAPQEPPAVFRTLSKLVNYKINLLVLLIPLFFKLEEMTTNELLVKLFICGVVSELIKVAITFAGDTAFEKWIKKCN